MKNLLKDGLETQIYTQYNEMRNKHNFCFAFNEYNSKLDLSGAQIYNNFRFGANSSIQDFYLDVEKLIEIIRMEKIDIIHAHPFYSLYPAVFAAKIAGIPIVYSFHGYGSLNFPYQVNDVILLQAMLESEVDKIFSVSKIGIDAIANATNTKKTIYMPNSIDINKYKKHKIMENKIWALISRIDNDKIEEIYNIISIMDKIDIKQICVYGDGNKKEELINFIKSNNLEDKVLLKGHCDNLSEELNRKYNGVIGIGRVIMESIAMNYPTILIGYKKIAGVVNLKMYEDIKKYNFINRNIPDIKIEDLRNQVNAVYKHRDDRRYLYIKLKKEYSSKKTYINYENEIRLIKYSTTYNIRKIYEELKYIDNKDEHVYSSRLLYNILKKYIETECLSNNLKNYFISFNNYYNLLDTTYKQNVIMQNDIINIKNLLKI